MPGKSLVPLFGVVLAAWPVSGTGAQEPVTLAERFDRGTPYRVELQVRLDGRLALPGDDGKPQEVPLTGASTLIYDERPLPSDDPRGGKSLRAYRVVRFNRTMAGKEQSADVRPGVRRMVVMRSEKGKKAPFSPDGPLTWGEIDVVRTDLFCPVLVPGLLPGRAVRAGEKWPATAAAVADLTDLDPIEEGGVTVEFVGVVTLDGKRYAKLSLAGQVRGQSEDGPARQKLDGLAYFDLADARLSYLKLTGVSEMLSREGRVTGRLTGTFTMTRGPAERTDDIADGVVRPRDLVASDDNTQLLYDNPDLGLRFLYPRRWRVGAVTGRQVTVDEPTGGGVLLSVEPAAELPTADQYLRETQDFFRKQGWRTGAIDGPRRAGPVGRFGTDATIAGKQARLEYAVLTTADGGVTAAARLPWADRDALGKDLDRILGSLEVTKRIGR
ncbi:MAG: hypothetical protein U0871_08465 [Gemmataceae bacterium]